MNKQQTYKLARMINLPPLDAVGTAHARDVARAVDAAVHGSHAGLAQNTGRPKASWAVVIAKGLWPMMFAARAL